MKQITEEQIRSVAKARWGTIENQVAFEDGIKWMQEQMQPEVPFTVFVQGLELSQKDKDLVKGVYYGWLTSRK